MSQPPLTTEELNRIRVSLAASNITLGEHWKSGGRAHIYKGEDQESCGGSIIVRIASKPDKSTAGEHTDRGDGLPDNVVLLRNLLDGCPQGFVLPIRKISIAEDRWSLSIWERCEGNLLELQGQFDSSDLLTHFRNLAHALEYLHCAGYMHCDVTPRNILVKGQLVRLCDYDLLLKYMDESTQSLSPRGTPGYRAPDFKSSAIFSADLWSLAVCYAELRCHRYPFEDRKDPKWPPQLPGMGREERRVVSAALSFGHEDRLRFAPPNVVVTRNNLHTAWIAALEKAIRDDGLASFHTSAAANTTVPAQITIALHGVRESGKTTFLAMMKHPGAGLTVVEKERIQGLRVYPVHDADGTGTSTFEYLDDILSQIEESGSPESTDIALSKSLRYEVTIEGRHAVVSVEDYGGELVQLKARPEAEAFVDPRMRQIAACDIQLLFIPVDHTGRQVQSAVDKLRGFLREAAKNTPHRPRPVIGVVYTKADTIEASSLDLKCVKQMTAFRAKLSRPVSYETIDTDEPDHDHVVNPDDITRLLPDVTPIAFVVSAYGRVGTGGVAANFKRLRPVNVWVPFGRTVDKALENVSDWCDEQLLRVVDVIETGRLVEADQALTKAIALIQPHLRKYPEAAFKIEAVRSDLKRRSSVARVKSLRRTAMAVTVAFAILLSVGWGYKYHTTQKALQLFASEVSAVNALSDFDFRERHSRRKRLLGAWYADKWYIGTDERSSHEKLLEADYGLIEDSDLEAMLAFRESQPGVDNAQKRLDRLASCDTRRARHADKYDAMRQADVKEMEDADLTSERSAREQLEGREHAGERLGRLAKVPSRSGSHKAQYDEWESFDRDEIYWDEEGKAVASLLGQSGSTPSHILDEVRKYRAKFSRSSKAAEISQLEKRAEDEQWEMRVSAAYGKALSVESSNSSHPAVIKAWREFVSFAGSHTKSLDAEKRIRDREAAWDAEEYAALVERYLSIAKLGDSVPKADIANFANAATAYLGCDRSLKRMEPEVRVSWERASRLSNGTAEATITLESMTIPWGANFWSQWSSTEITEVAVATSAEQSAFTVNVKEFGWLFSPSVEKYTTGNVLTLKCAWGDDFSVVVSEKDDTSSPGTQKASIRLPRSQRTTLTLSPVVKSEPSAKVAFHLKCDEFDLTRLALPAYKPIVESK